MEEGVVFQGPDLVCRIDCLTTAEAVAVHVVGLEHVGRCLHLIGGLPGYVM
jgi:hypothetical protein